MGARSWGLWAHVGHKDGSLASVHHECLRALVRSSWRVLLALFLGAAHMGACPRSLLGALVGACGQGFIGCLWGVGGGVGGTVAGAPFIIACGHLWALLVGPCGWLRAFFMSACGRLYALVGGSVALLRAHSAVHMGAYITGVQTFFSWGLNMFT